VTQSGDSDFGFAIVGVGMIARFHTRAIADVPGARVAAAPAYDAMQ
jgi:predicted dehydrogenase